MTNDTCSRVAETLEAARSNRLQGELKVHSGDCPDCIDTLLVDSFLLRQAASEPTLRPLPDPTLIWDRARHHARQRDLRRALMPLELIEVAAGAVATAATLGMLIWKWPVIAAWFSGLGNALPDPSTTPLPGAASLLFTGALLAVGALASEMYAAWSRT